MFVKEGINYMPGWRYFGFVGLFNPDDPDCFSDVELTVELDQLMKDVEAGIVSVQSLIEDATKHARLPVEYCAVLLRNAGIPLLFLYLRTQNGTPTLKLNRKTVYNYKSRPEVQLTTERTYKKFMILIPVT